MPKTKYNNVKYFYKHCKNNDEALTLVEKLFKDQKIDCNDRIRLEVEIKNSKLQCFQQKSNGPKIAISVASSVLAVGVVVAAGFIVYNRLKKNQDITSSVIDSNTDTSDSTEDVHEFEVSNQNVAVYNGDAEIVDNKLDPSTEYTVTYSFTVANKTENLDEASVGIKLTGGKPTSTEVSITSDVTTEFINQGNDYSATYPFTFNGLESKSYSISVPFKSMATGGTAGFTIIVSTCEDFMVKYTVSSPSV